MTFNDALTIIRTELKSQGSILKNEYDGLIVKKLTESNTLDDSRKSHQSHIAITGEQINMFPYIRMDAYFSPPYDKADMDMKKYFVLQVPIYITLSNINYLNGSIDEFSIDNQELSFASIMMSRRNNQENQLQLSLKKYDSKSFIKFRKSLHTNDFMILLKIKEKVEYEIYGIKSTSIKNATGFDSLTDNFYHDNTLSLVYNYKISINDNIINDSCKIDNDTYHTGFSSMYSNNRILFGAPGTGKSYTIKQDSIKLLGSEDSTDYERVTFHSDYSYASFVGTYKPVPTIDEDGKKSITYKYVPGPFLRVLVKALRNAIAVKEGREEAKPYLLIVEEINRAHIASVFGDVFQLLDRNGLGVSEYDIHVSEDMRDYLADALGCNSESCEKIRIPDNMFIWASMNSADQGVFPMDTAFKRRWIFKYIGVDDEEFDSQGKEYQNDTFIVAGEEIEWNVLRRAINAKLSSDKIKLHEDKLMGSFFLKILDEEGNSLFTASAKNEEFIELFCDKVLMYLFEDAAKTKRRDLFEGIKETNQLNRYSYVCKQFRKLGIKIFGDTFKKDYYDTQKADRDKKQSQTDNDSD